MKIKFLGTSAGWPLPRLGCNCDLCKSKDPKDHRLRPSVLVNSSILIDAPPDIYHQLARLNNLAGVIKNFRVLVLTHSHPDHILGFYDLTHLYNRSEHKPRIITTQEVINGFRLFHRYPLNPFIPEIIKINDVVEVENVKISLFPVEHSHIPCFGVKMKQDKLFVYIPDFKKLPKSVRKTCKDVHLLVLDGSSLGKQGQTRIHESIKEGIDLAKSLKPKKCYFTHIGHLTGRHQSLENFAQENGNHNFHIAYDNLELEV